MEVEGVWVSRPTTPEKGSRQSSIGSAALQLPYRYSEDYDIEKNIPLVHTRTASGSTTGSARPPSSSFDRAVSAERLPPSTNTSRDSSLDAPIRAPAPARHPPCAFARYSNTPYVHRYSVTQSSQEDFEAAQRASLEAIQHASTSAQHEGSASSDDSIHSNTENEPISASAPTLLSQPSAVARPRIRQLSVDFEMMNNHRMSQAAETGQLTPRVRRPGQSRDSSVASVRTEHIDYFAKGHKVAASTSSSGGSSPTNPFSTPKLDALPAAVRRSSMPDVTPFAQFCQTAPPSPKMEASTPPSQDSGTRRYSEAPTVYASAPSSPVLEPVELEAEPVERAAEPGRPVSVLATILPDYTDGIRNSEEQERPKRSSFENRSSRILRGHGTGFEILAPGSLNPPSPLDEDKEKQKVGPPISLHNAHRRRSISANSGRKLQKKRRPSMDSASMSSSETRKSRVSIFGSL